MNWKIAVVTETWPPDINGVALTTEKMVLGFLSRGYEVDLYRPNQAQPYPQKKGLTDHLVHGITLPWYKEVRFGLPATRYLKKSWKKNRPDLIQIVTEGPLGWAAMYTAKRMNIPVISEFHTNFHQYSQYYHLGWFFKLANNYLRWFHNQSSVILVATKELQKSMQSDGFKHIQVVSRGIDVDSFNPNYRSDELRQEWGLEKTELAVIHVGRLAKEKNLDLAVSAFREIEKICPDAKMIMVGDGPARSTLEKDNPDFIFSGMQKGKDLARHYASGDLFLSPSTSETFGNVTLEAMASGLAIVCFDYAAAREHITNEVHALSVPLNDNLKFIEMSTRLADDEGLRLKLVKSSIIQIQNVSWDSVIDAFEEHINTLIVNRSNTEEGSKRNQTV